MLADFFITLISILEVPEKGTRSGQQPTLAHAVETIWILIEHYLANSLQMK
jgi:hypothetical protein